MAVGDNDFPRGGQVTNKTTNEKSVISLFGNSKSKKAIKSKQVKKPSQKISDSGKNENGNEIVSKSAEALCYKSVREGMIILGCVHKVNDMAIQVSLPGLIYGHVMVTNISKPYTSYLQSIVGDNQFRSEDYKSLKNMFKPGQYVCTKVLNFEDKNKHLNLSLNPSDIHHELKHNEIAEGSIHMVAVQSIEDHGYIIDFGLTNCRAFLPNKDVPQSYGKLGIGELIWCSINKITTTQVATTLNLTALNEKLIRSILIKDISLTNILPGMKIEVIVDKILPNGLQVKFFQRYLGYISLSHLQNTNYDVSNYSKGQAIEATVLLIDATTKLTYLTMRDLKSVTLPEKFKLGDIVQGKVVSRSARGVYLNLSRTLRGFMTYKRVMTNENIDSNEIYMKFGKGTTHNVRIISFDYMENSYICSCEKKTLKENCFTLADFNIGQFVTAVIQNINSKRLIVQVGKVTGIITALHISDFPIQKLSIISRYTLQQVVKCRVLQIIPDEQKLYLTMKPSLMNKDALVLSSFNEVVMNNTYKGVVVQILSSGLVVAFFNNMKGFVPINQFGIENVTDPKKIFFIGQTVECSILNSNESKNRLTLSLKIREKKNNETSVKKNILMLGDKVTGIVKKLNKNGLHISVDGTECFLPKALLTQSRNINDIVLRTFKVNDIINNLICIKSDIPKPILSLCDGQLFKCEENNSEFSNHIAGYPMLDFEKVSKGTIVKGWIQIIKKDHLVLHCALHNFKGIAKVRNTDLLDDPVDDLEKLNLLPYQPLVLKVLHINVKKQILSCSAKLCDVWNMDTQMSASILMAYLSHIHMIQNNKKIAGLPMANLSIGEHIQGRVKQVCNDNVIFELPNNIRAIAHVNNSCDLQCGESVLCVIIWLDFVRNQVEVIFDKKNINKISEVQDTNRIKIQTSKSLKCATLLVKEDVIIGVLDDSKQLVFLPTFCHTNHLQPIQNDFSSISKYDVHIVGMMNGHAVCVFKDYPKINNCNLQSNIIQKYKKNKNIDSETKNENSNPTNSNSAQVSEDIMNNYETNITRKPVKRSPCQDDNLVSESPSTKRSKKSIEKTHNELEDMNVTNTKFIEDKSSSHLISTNGNKSLGLLEAYDFFQMSSRNVQEDVLASDSDVDLDIESVNKKKRYNDMGDTKSIQNDENKIRENAVKLAESYENPQTADHFDRLVLANPNDSMSWINYMAYHLQATEIEKARAVAQKALSSISFREEQEKMNVWIALLNLENRYGTKETFNNTLFEALQKNDAYNVYMQAIQILSESSKIEEFSDLIHKVLKKYNNEIDCWLNVGHACFKAKLIDKARQIMQKGLDVLPNNKHVQLLVRFASLENQFGNIERAQTLFEKIVISYPQRIDIWSHYIDMLIKSSQINTARDVLKRAISQRLPAKKMKVLFKKLLDFETKYGNDIAIAEVREMAEKYVRDATNI